MLRGHIAPPVEARHAQLTPLSATSGLPRSTDIAARLLLVQFGPEAAPQLFEIAFFKGNDCGGGLRAIAPDHERRIPTNR